MNVNEHIPGARPCSNHLTRFNSFSHPENHMRSYHYYSRFTNEEAEPGDVELPKVTQLVKEPGRDLNPGHLAPESALVTKSLHAFSRGVV